MASKLDHKVNEGRDQVSVGPITPSARRVGLEDAAEKAHARYARLIYGSLATSQEVASFFNKSSTYNASPATLGS